jgi:uncharacterized membrane protein
LGVEREKKHQLGQLVALIGFLMIPLGAIVYSYMHLSSSFGAGTAVLGFLIFISGAELAFKTKEDSEAGNT